MFLFACLVILGAGRTLFAQTKKTPPKKTVNQQADSATRARQAALEANRKAQQHMLDSMKASRLHFSDSLRAARKKVTDSLTAIRNYKQSKKYTDSVAKSRMAKVNQLRNAQKARTDSLRAARKHVTDSIVAIRTHVMDSIHTKQKHRADSLMAIRKYKESKRYRDSVGLFKQARMDSMRVARKKFNDSAIAARKHVADSAIAVRKHVTDSVTAIRKMYTDSIKTVRKARADSLAKVKEVKEKQQKANEKLKEDKMKLALELKIKKRHMAWSNEKMLKKKWSLPRQAVQNTFTRYNYYFNSDKKMDEALANMQRARRENYDSLLALFPFDPDRDSTLLSADMDSIIHKASVGIQIHDPRTKWGDDLYLLMGEAYYYKGDYENAITCFRYIVSLKDKYRKKKTPSRPTAAKKSKEEPSIAEADNKTMLDFLKHKTAHNKALLWLSRVYVQMRRPDDAESVQDLLAADRNFPEDLKGRLAVEKAFLNLKKGNYKDASTQLAEVTADNSIENWLRMRAAYINGQISQQEGNYLVAADNFRKVIDLQPKIDMDFYARKNLAYSLMYAGGDQKEAVASLKRMLNDGKYSPYYEQVYFVLGRLAANGNNTDDAVTYLKKSIASAKSTKKQKAVSFATLGNVYYKTGNYEAAKSAYDSAAYFGGHAADDPDVQTAVLRSKTLGEITGPARIIHTEDSLLALSALPEKEQRAAIRRYIRRLEQQRADSIFRAENAAVAGGNNDGPAADNNYASWYFSNPVLMQQGVNEFKRKWGSRPLADNWRRSSAGGFAGSNTTGNNNNSNNNATDSQNPDLDENGLPTEESLLAMIPNTQERQDQSRKRIQQAYIDMGNTYIRQLEDYQGGLSTLDTLDTRYANHPHKAQSLYLRYLAALRRNQLDKAQQYSAELQQQYGSSQYASLVKPTEDGGQAVNTNASVAEFYDQSYDLLMQRQYTEVIRRTEQAQKQYTDARYAKRFSILEASALAGSANYERADVLVSDFLKNYPADSLRNWAEAIQQYITAHKPAAPPPPDPATKLANGPGHTLPPQTGNEPPAQLVDPNTGKPVTPQQPNQQQQQVQPQQPSPGAGNTIASNTSSIPAAYTYKPQEDHYFVFAVDKTEDKVMGVKAALTDVDNIRFSGQGLTTTFEPQPGGKGFVVTKGFHNSGQAKIYMNNIKSSPEIMREYKAGEYQVFMISAKNYLKMVADHDLSGYLNFYRQHYK